MGNTFYNDFRLDSKSDIKQLPVNDLINKLMNSSN